MRPVGRCSLCLLLALPPLRIKSLRAGALTLPRASIPLSDRNQWTLFRTRPWLYHPFVLSTASNASLAQISALHEFCTPAADAMTREVSGRRRRSTSTFSPSRTLRFPCSIDPLFRLDSPKLSDWAGRCTTPAQKNPLPSSSVAVSSSLHSSLYLRWPATDSHRHSLTVSARRTLSSDDLDRTARCNLCAEEERPRVDRCDGDHGRRSSRGRGARAVGPS